MPFRSKAGEIIGTFGISKDITAIKQAEAKLEQVHKQLLDTSRQAGMAEVATSVLHNVGNVLNSVNISSSLASDKIRQSKVSLLTNVVALLQAQGDDLPGFFARDPKGRQLPGFLSNLANRLAEEQKEVLEELGLLIKNIEHIKEIVAMQQSYAKVSGLLESLSVADLVEDALRMNAGAMERHQVRVIREYAEVPPALVEKHKVLQILVNLIRNAKYALDDGMPAEKRMILRVGPNGKGGIRISVIDNGIGIPVENQTRIFGHGFTTRKDGHGFGLHNGALTARELGGALTVHSEGPGKGATFSLEFPCQPKEKTT
jgi:signal transduction histidine kinase